MWPLEGTWHNELGSTMTIDPLDPVSQSFTGTYTTAVSTGCAHGSFPLVGRSDVQDGGETVGWIVCWRNDRSQCGSTTAWSGQFRLGPDDEQSIVALWLLTMETSEGEEWASTLVGHDVFQRTKPTEEAVGRVLGAKRHSHP